MKLFSHKRIDVVGVRQSNLNRARSRLFLIGSFFAVAYIIVAARAADVAIIQGNLNKVEIERGVYNSAANKSQESSEEEFIRTDIVDRNNVVLARSLKTFSLFSDTAMVQEPVRVAKDLKKVFPELSYGDVLQKLQSGKRFVWLKRNITPEQQSKILYLGYPGLDFKTEMKRVYPQGALVSHLVGSSGVDGQGLSAIESSFDGLLSKGVGEQLQLTLDIRLQHVLKREVSKSITDFNGKAGAGIVMDVETGEVLAAVSLPDYDPQKYQKAKTQEKFNRFSLGVYELGSTFKIFSTAAMLEKTNSNVSKNFDVREPLVIGRHKIRDYHSEDRILTMPEVFIHSSNIGSAMMGQAVGTDGLKNFYKDIGLLDSAPFEISEVGKPFVPSPWGEVSTMTASFGHGIAVSPLQLVSATASIMNGGVLVKPKLVKSGDSKVEKSEGVRVVSSETSHRMRQLLRLVVTQGTGGNADVEGYLVGGKTGTAEKPGRGGYDRKKLISSFLGVFPMDKPKYAVFVMVDEPQGTKASYGYATGGWVAAPAVKRVISSMVSILNLSPSSETEGFEKSLMRYVKTKEQLKKEKQRKNAGGQKIASH